MKINIITLFPKMFESPFAESIIKRAIKNKIVDLKIHNLRDFSINNYGSVDDRPFGGNVGMLIRPEPVYKALEAIKKDLKGKTKIILMSARGSKFDQKKAEELAKIDNLIIVSGHYEGFDQRVSDFMVDEEISIGDYVLTGGELPAMVITDAILRLVPNVLGKDKSHQEESWSEIEIDGKKIRAKEYSQYTRPQEFMGHRVPKVLISGDPKKIKKWQEKQILDNSR